MRKFLGKCVLFSVFDYIDGCLINDWFLVFLFLSDFFFSDWNSKHKLTTHHQKRKNALKDSKKKESSQRFLNSQSRFCTYVYIIYNHEYQYYKCLTDLFIIPTWICQSDCLMNLWFFFCRMNTLNHSKN